MNQKLLMGIILAILVAAIGVGFYLVANDKDKKENNMDNNEQTNNSVTGSDNISTSTDHLSNNILIVYYSRTNNTETIANYIKEKTGGDLFQVETVKPYPDDYTKTTEVASEEKNNNARPEIKTTLSVDNYDTIFIGCPIWWGTCPMAIFTYIESQDFSGKTIIPFTTSGGSGLGTVENDLKESTNASNYLKGFTISGSRVETARETVDNWIDSLNLK